MAIQFRKYYSSRINGNNIDIPSLQELLNESFIFFRQKDYFKEKLNITSIDIPKEANSKSMLAIRRKLFLSEGLDTTFLTKDKIFDAIEFLFDHISKPGEWGNFTTETGWNYMDYESYDDKVGKQEFRDAVNVFLCDFENGYELSRDGEILTISKDGLEEIIDAQVPRYDMENVENIIKKAIHKFRNRNEDIDQKKAAIKDLADVLEFLRKKLTNYKILSKADDGTLFEIANKFAIRHHDLEQHKEYDKTIWYSWIFHFYLATLHAGIRFIKNYEAKNRESLNK